MWNFLYVLALWRGSSVIPCRGSKLWESKRTVKCIQNWVPVAWMLKAIMSTISVKNFKEYRPPSTIELTFDIARLGDMIMRLQLSKLGFWHIQFQSKCGLRSASISSKNHVTVECSEMTHWLPCLALPVWWTLYINTEIGNNDRKVLPSPPTTLIVRRKNLNDLQLKTISHTFPRIKGLYSPLRTWDYFATGHLKSFERFLSLLRMESSQKYERKYTKIRKILMGPAFNGMISWVTTTEQTWW